MTDRGAARETVEAGGFEVHRFVLNDLLTNGFVVRHVGSGEIAIVDPGARGACARSSSY